MRIRHFLLSGVVFGSFALMSPASWSAPQVAYQPKGDWAVSRVAAKGPGKDPYCTMARRFNDNVILTFARNAKDESSLAIDFQSGTLAKGQNYYVTLDAGSQQKRAFDVTPLSDKAMIIRLGQDTAFHNALNQSGMLNVDVAGLTFTFDMPDMAKGHEDLSGCVTSIVEPAAGDTMAAVRKAEDILSAPVTNDPVAPAPMIHDDALVHDLEALKDENSRLKAALEQERREYEDRIMKESSDSSQVSEVMEKLRILEKENGDLKYQLADARSMESKAKETTPAPAPAACTPTVVKEVDPEQMAELSRLREENARLQSDLSAQKTAMAQLETQIAEATKAESGKASADTATIARLQSRVDELMVQNSKLQSDLTSAQASASTASAVNSEGAISISQLRSVEAQLQSVESERDNLRAQLAKMSEGQEEGRLKLSGSDWDLEQATRRYNEAEREIRRLGSQLEQSRTKCAAEKKEIEYMLFDPEIADQQQISKLMSLEEEVKAAKAELARKDTEVSQKISDYEKKLESLESELETAKSKDLAYGDKKISSIEPAAGMPQGDMLPVVSVVDAEPIAEPAVAGPGDVSLKQIEPASVVLPPKSAVSADSYQSTTAVVSAIVQDPDSPLQTAQGNAQLVTADALSGQLRQAGLSLSGDVKKIENVSGPDFVAFSWDSGSVFGSAEQKVMAHPEQFQTLVNQYLDKTKSRCTGEFAASPVPTQEVAGIQVASYEIACVNPDGGGATAALVFYGKDALFTTVAHESGMDTIDMAMDARDRVIAGLASHKL